jgi:hypothetical protein
MIVTPFLLASMTALQVAPAGPIDPSTVKIDGHIQKPRSTDIAYDFDCGGNSIALAWRQQWLPLEEVPLAKAQSVRLVRLLIRPRPIAAAHHRQVQNLFAGFAWIETAEVNCPEDKIEISIRGMLHRSWIDYVEERIEKNPGPVTKKIEVTSDGSIRIVD